MQYLHKPKPNSSAFIKKVLIKEIYKYADDCNLKKKKRKNPS